MQLMYSWEDVHKLCDEWRLSETARLNFLLSLAFDRHFMVDDRGFWRTRGN